MALHKKELSPKKVAVKRRIIDASLELFSRYGFENTSVSQVASRAEVADGTIYLYFRNKDDLMTNAYSLAIEIIIEEIDVILKEIDNPLAKYYAIFDAHITVFHKRPDVITFIISNLFRLPRVPFSHPSYEGFRKYLAYIQNICKQAIDKGYLREVNSEFLAYHTHSILDYLARTWIVSGYNIDMTYIKNKMLDIMMYGLVP